jgi:hypothetical protein
VTIVTSDDSYYILRYDSEALGQALASGEEIDDEGVEDAFDVLEEIDDTVATATWVSLLQRLVIVECTSPIATRSWVLGTPRLLLAWL